MLTVGSLFSGIGGFDLGLERAGFEVAFQCDNDPFCNKVLAHHWPGVKRYDDVRSIGNAFGQPSESQQLNRTAGIREQASPQWTGQAIGQGAAAQGAVGRDGEGRRGSVDLICGGFPCQDLSVAGKRAGLDGDRSGLWFEFKRILSELRPTWAIIENVPGLLSSNQGRDFAIVLDGLGECGFAGIAWAVLDSQHFGVAQRRRRVYVVAGPSRRSVEQVLSLCEGCGGHPAPRREAREDVTGPIAGGAYGTGRRTEDDPNLVLDLSYQKRLPNESGNAYWARMTREEKERGITPAMLANTLPGHHPRHDLDNDTYVATGAGYWQEGRLPNISAHDAKQSEGTILLAATLRSASDSPAAHHKLNGDDVGTLLPTAAASVRRLTPTECERLQGFPDGWTALDGAADGPRYKALGNAVSVPVIEYLGLRIAAVSEG